MKRLLTICAVVGMLSVMTAQGAVITPDGTFAVKGVEIAFHKQGSTVTLSAPGDYDWWYGCSPTSTGMIMGHYDVHGYSGQSYNNLVPGGAAENSTFSGSGPFLANSVIASSGHQYDFYGNVDGSTDRSTFVYDTGGSTVANGYGYSGEDLASPWHSFDSLADFMGTSQDSYGNWNGSTNFYYFTDGSPFAEADAFTYGVAGPSGMYGIGEYLEYAGYDADVLYNQYIDAAGKTYGFTFVEYMAEIDAGRPVMIHVEDHSMYGYGYDSDTTAVLLHDTWTGGEHSMTWGGTYSGLDHYGVTVLTPIPEPATVALLGLGSLFLIRRKRRA